MENRWKWKMENGNRIHHPCVLPRSRVEVCQVALPGIRLVQRFLQADLTGVISSPEILVPFFRSIHEEDHGMIDIIVTEHGPKPIGPYSQAVRAMVFSSPRRSRWTRRRIPFSKGMCKLNACHCPSSVQNGSCISIDAPDPIP